MSDSLSEATKAPRSSNIELLRVLAMFIIVLHHYCVNSGLLSVLNLTHPDFNTLWVQFASLGGTTGINIFFLITGYFMCRSTMHWSKLVSFAFQIFSVSAIVYVFLIFQGMHYTVADYAALVPFVSGMPVSFISTYVVLYMLSGVINKALDVLSRKEMSLLVIVLIVYFSLAPMVPFVGDTWHYLGWGFTMYCLGAYIRRYDLARVSLPYGWLVLLMLAVSWGTIYAFDLINARVNFNSYDWMFFIKRSSRPFPFLTALALFMLFLRWQLPYNKAINKMGGATFGVLLWHATGAPMRQWLWRDTLDNAGHFTSPYFWLHCLCSVVVVYSVCTILELLRQRIIQRPFDAWIRNRGKRREAANCS